MHRSSASNNNSLVNILDRPIGRGLRSSTDQSVVSLSMFSYLYSEMVQYHQNRVDSISELERKLESTGYGVGLRVLELLAYRSKEYKRETRLMNILQFISTTVWKSLFNRPADSLERSIDHADEFMIVDYTPITSTFVSVPSDFGGLSVDAYLSGIIAGILEGAGFPSRVTAHTVALEEGETAPHPIAGLSGTGGAGGVSAAASGLLSSSSSASATGSVHGAGGSSASLAALSGNHLPPRREKAVFLVKFAQSVIARDSSMG